MLGLQPNDGFVPERLNITPVEPGASVSAVAANLSWSNSLLSGAKTVIRNQVKDLQGILDQYRASGATQVKVNDAGDVATSNDARALGSLTRFMLTAGDKAGKVVGTSDPIPTDIKNYSGYLVRLKSSNCSLLVGKNICQIKAPTPGEFLNLELRSHLVYTQVQSGWNFTIAALNYIVENKRAVHIVGGQLVSDLSGFSVSNNIPMSVTGLGGWTITLDSPSKTINFTESRPDPKKLARTGKYNAKYGIFTF
jgi:hypothetical protein